MIRQLQIENFRCLRSVTMTLEPLTVFVGANASGKSSVFAALAKANRGDYVTEDFWARKTGSPIRITTRGDEGVETQRGTCPSIGTSPVCQHLQFDLTHLRATSTVIELRSLHASGQGLPNVFATLTRREQDAIAKSFCELVPMFADITLRPHGPGKHWVLFQDRWHPEIWHEPTQVSDGSMLLLAYLLLPYQSPPPDIIAIEEPERGLHPYLMGQLVSVLRRLANGDLGPRKVQVLLATHSAELLEFVKPEEVRLFTRPKNTGETRVEMAPVNDPSWPKTLRVYDESLGDLWLSGGLGGVPGHG